MKGTATLDRRLTKYSSQLKARSVDNNSAPVIIMNTGTAQRVTLLIPLAASQSESGISPYKKRKGPST